MPSAVHFAIYRKVPRIFTKLSDSKEHVVLALVDASIEELKTDWEYCGPIDDTPYSRLTAWITVVANKFTDKSVNNYDRKKMLLDIMMSKRADIEWIQK